MSVLSLSYSKSDVYWRQNNKHFAELAPQNGGKQLIWRNYVTVTLCILLLTAMDMPCTTVCHQAMFLRWQTNHTNCYFDWTADWKSAICIFSTLLVKLGTHYPCPWAMSKTTPVFKGRGHDPWTRVVCTQLLSAKINCAQILYTKAMSGQRQHSNTSSKICTQFRTKIFVKSSQKPPWNLTLLLVKPLGLWDQNTSKP